MKSPSDLETARQFLHDNPDIEVIEVLLIDLNGAHRGKWIPRHKLESVFAGGLSQNGTNSIEPLHRLITMPA